MDIPSEPSPIRRKRWRCSGAVGKHSRKEGMDLEDEDEQEEVQLKRVGVDPPETGQEVLKVKVDPPETGAVAEAAGGARET